MSSTSTLERVPGTYDPAPPAVADAAEQALFAEARRRRRRWWGYGIVAFAVLAGVAAGVGIGFGGGPPATPLPTSAQSFAGIVSARTRAAGTAGLSFTYRNATVGGCIPDTNAPVTSGHGTIDFAHRAMSVAMVTRGCGNLMRVDGPVRETQVGGKVFRTLPPGSGRPTSRARPWLLEAGAHGASLPGVLVSPHMLAVLDALAGNVKRVGPSVVHGVPTTIYEGQTTLAGFYRAVSGFFQVPAAASGGSLVPSASSIRIDVTMWVDPAEQLVRLRAVEPLYTAVYANGSDEEGAAQADAVAPGDLGVRTLRQQSSLTVTVGLGRFGSPATISAPSPGTVTRAGR